MKKIILPLSIILLLSSCSKTLYHGYYGFQLNEVEQEGNTLMDTTSYALHYKDSILEIKWAIFPKSAYFTLSNLSKSNFQILWDQAAFVNEYGQSKKIFHNGVQLIDASRPHAPSTVVSGTSINKWISSSENIIYLPPNSQTDGHWLVENIYIDPQGKVQSEVADKTKSGLGKQIIFTIPISQNGKTYAYNFHFHADSYVVKREQEYAPGRTKVLFFFLLTGILLVVR